VTQSPHHRAEQQERLAHDDEKAVAEDHENNATPANIVDGEPESGHGGYSAVASDDGRLDLA
jgi:hypothetical protein